MAQTANDLLKGITGAILGGQEGGGGKAQSPADLAALKKARTPNAGVNTGGRHDPRRGAVQGNTQGPQRMLQPPSRGRTMNAKQSMTDEQMLSNIGDQMGGGGQGGVPLGGIASQNPQALISAGLRAVTNMANGQKSPQDQKAAMDLVMAVQSGIVPATPDTNRLIDAMKRAGLLNQSNIPTFGAGGGAPPGGP